MQVHSNTSPALQSGHDANREAYLQRARENAKLTSPYLFLPIGFSPTSDLNQPWESTGGFLLNNLANKIAQSLFPAALPWIRFDLVPELAQQVDELPDGERERVSQRISAQLSRLERDNFTRQVNKDGDIIVLARCILQLLVAGNYCIQSLEDGTLKGRKLDMYTTKRDGQGNITSATLLDLIAFGDVDEDVKEIVVRHKYGAMAIPEGTVQSDEDVKIVTNIRLEPSGQYVVYQETYGEEIANTRKTYDRDTLPYFFPVYELLDGEDYGRSYVESYIGDLESLDAQSEIVQRGTAAGAKLIRLVRVGSEVSKQALAQANTGDTLTGREGDITTVQANKGADYQASLNVQDRIIARLNRAFLLGAGNIRNAERVTAEEIQFVSRELEQQLGSAYNGLVRNLQRPHALLKIRRMQRIGTLPNFNLDQVDVAVLTGAAALTRQNKVTQILQGLTPIAQLAPEALRERLDVDTLINLVSEGIGYSFAGLILSEEEMTRRRRERLAEETLAAQMQQPQQQPQQPPPTQQPQPQPVPPQ